MTPTFTFASIPNQTYGVAPFTVVATSNSTGAITYSVVSGPATIAGNTVTLTGAGTVTLQASQTAAGGYTGATVSTSFSVSGGTAPTLTSFPSSLPYWFAPFTVSAISNSTGAITYSVISGPATISGNTVTLTGVGTVTLQASQAAAGSYLAAATTTSFNVLASTPTLAFGPIPNQIYGAAPFAVVATSNSPGATTLFGSERPSHHLRQHGYPHRNRNHHSTGQPGSRWRLRRRHGHYQCNFDKWQLWRLATATAALAPWT